MKRENPLTNGGGLLLALGALAFFPRLFDREMLITAWLGDLQQPAGLSAMIVGGVLFATGKLQEFRNGTPVVGPTDAVVPNQLSAQEPTSEPQAPAEPPPV